MQEAIQTLVDQQAVLKPNDYAFNASALFNVIADHSGHAKMTDTVPFLTYALSGYKDVFSRYYNFFGNMQTEILRMIDFHLFPSYIVTEESAYALLDTPSYDLYTTSFDLWFDTIQSSYSQVDDALSAVYQSHVVSRTIISTGISEITYANGVTLVINYLSDSFNYQTYVLPAHSVTTIGGSL